MSRNRILTPGGEGNGHGFKRAFEINDLFKVSFVAGAAVALDMIRSGAPFANLGEIEVKGNLAFGHLFTNEVVTPTAAAQAIDLFDRLWKLSFEGK